MKLWKMVGMAVCMNIMLFLLVFILPYNPIQVFIGILVSLFVFIFGGIRVAIVQQAEGFVLATATGQMLLYQTFYELLTITSLTIPLYLRKWKTLGRQLIKTLVIILSYYTILYGITIILLEKGFNPTVLVKFIRYNTESFMFFAFILLWYHLNRSEINKLKTELIRHN